MASAGERSADQIQRDIEESRAALASSVDQLVYRTSPKRLVEKGKQTAKDRAQSTPGKIAIGVVAALAVVLVVQRVRKR